MAKINFQAWYLKDLWNDTICPRFDVNAVVKLFDDWELMKKADITTSRIKPFKSAINRTVGAKSDNHWDGLTLNEDEKASS
jgi:hypothetical protein